jgi:hypothetical protein
MFDTVMDILRRKDYSVIESFALPAIKPLHGPVPRFLFGSAVGPYLEKSTG